ncbi:hypothetical protein [Streptomyces lydicus]|uniref:hypothetical protein n=1 Tax=Streptomyces lydicus TaxID=47763 RepID=UPI003D9DB7CF
MRHKLSITDAGGTSTVRTAREGDHLLVDFCDTGPRTPAEIRNRIFAPFPATHASRYVFH